MVGEWETCVEVYHHDYAASNQLKSAGSQNVCNFVKGLMRATFFVYSKLLGWIWLVIKWLQYTEQVVQV